MSEAADVAYIKQVEENYYGAEKKIATLNIIRWVLRIAILAMIVCFLWGSFNIFKSAVDPENLAPHFEDEITLLAPKVIDATKEIAEEIVPVYQKTAEVRLKNLKPMLEKKVQLEAKRYERELQETTAQSLRDTVNRVSNAQVLAMADRIPELKTPEGRSFIRERIQHILENESQEILPLVFDRFQSDADEIKDLLLSFKNNKYSDYEIEDLQRYFAHLWLMLLDQYIMNPESVNKGWE